MKGRHHSKRKVYRKNGKMVWYSPARRVWACQLGEVNARITQYHEVKTKYEAMNWLNSVDCDVVETKNPITKARTSAMECCISWMRYWEYVYNSIAYGNHTDAAINRKNANQAKREAMGHERAYREWCKVAGVKLDVLP